MALFLLIISYFAISVILFSFFRENHPERSSFHVGVVSALWLIFIPYAYVRIFHRNYRELQNEEDINR
ncbi:MAG: hypothetical protein FWD38_11980 [Oscillospiraceae bacterium]|nr:hypothetical protein [Oscillospiraceae bacterium]